MQLSTRQEEIGDRIISEKKASRDMAGASTPKTPGKKSGLPVDLYAAQCEKCFKWRLISTQEEYEDIRSKLVEEPFTCHMKSETCCDDPSDIEYDASRTWVIDKPNIPKTPEGFKRHLVLRRNFTKMDAYYITPTGKKVRSSTEMGSFVEANPKYKDVPLSNFNFAAPRIMEETIPESILREGLNSSSTKRIKKTKDESAHTG